MKDQIEKQAIEEMAKVIKSSLDGLGIGNFNFTGDEISTMFAKALYNEGYRRQSEGEWLVDGSDINRRAECSNCGHEYAVQKGMLQLQQFPYCPNCGAKMKGGAE